MIENSRWAWWLIASVVSVPLWFLAAWWLDFHPLAAGLGCSLSLVLAWAIRAWD